MAVVYQNENELFAKTGISEKDGAIVIEDEKLFREKTIDNLAATLAVAESDPVKRLSCWIIYQAAAHFKIFPASIQGLYEAMGRGETGGFTVPAINLRTLTYDLSRAIFRSAKKIRANAFIFEIAKSEISYTRQTPQEYAAMVMLAAIKEHYSGPLFLQGDHFQVNASAFVCDRDHQINQLKKIILQAIKAGFYNIDIDSSTLVDLSQSDVLLQQHYNCEICAYFTRFIRENQPESIEISIGGEIGEVGGKNSTEEELRAFMTCYRKCLENIKGISKMSIQTGTEHGGVVLPDGSIAKVMLDFDTLRNLSTIARDEYKLSGCVQHGASTLPNEAFHNFPLTGCSEIHLATQFQNVVYDYMPLSLKEKIYIWLHENCAAEKKSGQTNDQFIYRTRKRALGPFKKDIFSLKQDVRNKIGHAIEEEFDFLFAQLKITNTMDIVARHVKTIPVQKSKNDFFDAEISADDPAGGD